MMEGPGLGNFAAVLLSTRIEAFQVDRPGILA